MNVKSIFFYQKKHNPAGYVATNVIIMREYSDKYYGSYIYIYISMRKRCLSGWQLVYTGELVRMVPIIQIPIYNVYGYYLTCYVSDWHVAIY